MDMNVLKEKSSDIDGEDQIDGILFQTKIRSDDESPDRRAKERLTKPIARKGSKIQNILDKASIEAGNSKHGMPKWFKHQFRKLTQEQRLATWAQYQKRKFDFFDNNFKHLKKDTDKMEHELNRIKSLIEMQRSPVKRSLNLRSRMPLPFVEKLESDQSIIHDKIERAVSNDLQADSTQK